MCRRRCGAHTVAALMLSTSAREPARTSGTRGVGGERDGESEPKRVRLRTRAGHQHIRQVLRLRGLHGRPTIYRRLRRRNVSAVGIPDLEVLSCVPSSPNYFVRRASCTPCNTRITSMSWSVTTWGCLVRSPPWPKAPEGGSVRSVHSHPPCTAVCPPSGGSRKKWICTTSEREKTLTSIECALHHEIAVQLAEIANSEGG